MRSAVWLTAAPDSTTQSLAVSSYNDYTGGATVGTAAGSSILDGICLKCHKDGASSAGIGSSY